MRAPGRRYDEIQAVEITEPDLPARGERVLGTEYEHLPVGGDLSRLDLPAGRIVGDHGQVGPPTGDGGEGGVPVSGDHVDPATLAADPLDRFADHPPQRAPAGRDGERRRGLVVQLAQELLGPAA